jgi:nitroimidazol reductase NimA-like FMN-containing flavoprotein (pyridoxamine 5'-phosphate oxidase superfamily)
MSKAEIGNLISEQFLCRIAFVGEKYPHIMPFQYVVLNGVLYFHFTEYGTKMKLLESGSWVCVEIEKYESDLSEFQFVILKGSLEAVTDPSERAKAIGKMAEQGKRMLSRNFLTAHGFNKGDDWSSFIPDKPLTIVKLNPASESGLRSP